LGKGVDLRSRHDGVKVLVVVRVAQRTSSRLLQCGERVRRSRTI
jgi:hypothetical protein